MMHWGILVCGAVLLGSFSQTAKGEEATMGAFNLTSPSFSPNQPIPAKHSCEGHDASPELRWVGAPAGTKGFALICDDPDAPMGTWVHWVIYSIAAETSALPENVSKADTVAALGGVKQGVNDFGRVGYAGPCPPRGHGVHHYHFRLYALRAELDIAPRLTRKQLEEAMRGQVLAETSLIGTYERN